MRKLLLAAGVAALAISAPATADKGGQDRDGKNGQTAKADRQGKGAPRAAKAERRGGGDKAGARSPERREARSARAPERREARVKQSPQRREVRSSRNVERAKPVRVARDDRRPENVRDRSRDQRRVVQADRREDRRDDRSFDRNRNDNRFVQVDRRDGRRDDRRFVQVDRRDDRRDDRRFDRDFDRRDGFPLRFASRDYGWRDNDGCPPGLAKKRNGCLPPGQAKKLVGNALPAAFATSMLPAYYRSWYPDNDDYYYRTGNDFIYRIGRNDGLINGYMPLFDYADYSPDYYYVGERYPLDYVSFYNVPVAYHDYYEDDDDWLYRYGDGAIYRVDRSSGLVNAIMQLLAGDLAVGSPLPLGYDVYNVPYAYRDRYYDTPDHWYRYNDGYIYQVDPETRLVQAVIQALV